MLRPLHRSIPVVDDQGRPLQNLQLFSEDVARLALIIGTGSPEGVVPAKQGQEYMDDAGTAGAIKYIKKVDSIAGDAKQGWILI